MATSREVVVLLVNKLVVLFIWISIGMISGYLLVIVVDSPILTFRTTPRDFSMMPCSMLTLNLSNCLIVNREVSHSVIYTFKIWCTNMGRSLGPQGISTFCTCFVVDMNNVIWVWELQTPFKLSNVILFHVLN